MGMIFLSIITKCSDLFLLNWHWTETWMQRTYYNIVRTLLTWLRILIHFVAKFYGKIVKNCCGNNKFGSKLHVFDPKTSRECTKTIFDDTKCSFNNAPCCTMCLVESTSCPIWKWLTFIIGKASWCLSFHHYQNLEFFKISKVIIFWVTNLKDVTSILCSYFSLKDTLTLLKDTLTFSAIIQTKPEINQ